MLYTCINILPIEEANVTEYHIQNHRWTRDLLLPRRWSGQVELKTEAA